MNAPAATNRLRRLFDRRPADLLSVYFTAGFPRPDDTRTVLGALARAGADLIEIGVPFSDPIADGPTIQESNQHALEAGMTLRRLFDQLEGVRAETDVPLVLMGYLNPVVQYGVEAFCARCAQIGIDGLILPDLPLPVYQREYAALFRRYGLINVFLVTPQTSDDRIRQIDAASEGFIYLVSTAGTTGARAGITDVQEAYFQRIHDLQLRSPTLIGFGISDADSFRRACRYAHGAIIGSAFIRLLAQSQNLAADVDQFVKQIKGVVAHP